MLYRDSRLRETTTKSGLGPTFTVTSSVELWTSTRELRNFRGCHPCKLKCRLGILGLERRQHSTVLDRTLQLLVQLLKCYIGIVGFERRQQSRVLDRPLQLLVQLSFGLRRENLEIFVDAIHASTNVQLIHIYNCFFGFRLKCYIGIVGFEGRQQSRVLDRTLQLLFQLCFGLRREILEIFADAIHASTNE
ncbi:hypothetical protein V1477_015597 [Vespula maculifrons]|uniref:Uncharacterized protein n=1 Tax=Vespula maculifrons TaxID=7453 RepID=A0ABD2BEJ1_VESMC